MKRATTFALDALATYRLTKLVLDDEIFAGPRDKLLKKFPPHKSKIGFGLTCPWCVSIWAGMSVAVLRKVAPTIWDVAATGLAASALTGKAYEKNL